MKTTVVGSHTIPYTWQSCWCEQGMGCSGKQSSASEERGDLRQGMTGSVASPVFIGRGEGRMEMQPE